MSEETRRKDVYRTYRRPRPGLHCFRVAVGETDLWVEASWDCQEEVNQRVRLCRRQLKDYIRRHPEFLTTLRPWPDDDPQAPEIVQTMIFASKQAGVGPMAAVAGAVNSFVGAALLAERNRQSTDRSELLIENGGDLLISGSQPKVVAVYAGASPFSWRIGVRLEMEDYKQSGGRIGICTSAGRVGPSLSMGKADAAVILSCDPVLADAVATATANRIETPQDLEKAIGFASSIPQITGALLICGSKMAAWGNLQVVKIEEETKKGEEE